MVGAATNPTLLLLASNAFRTCSSNVILLARNGGSRAAHLGSKPTGPLVGRTVCYNRPLVRPNNYGLHQGSTRPRITSRSNHQPRSPSGGGSHRQYTTQGADGTYYSTGSTYGGYVPPESFTMSDRLFSIWLKGRGTQGKGKKKKHNARGSTEGTSGTYSNPDSNAHSKARARARLDAEDPHSANLAHIGSCDANCRAFNGTLAMINTVMESNESWRRRKGVVLTLLSKRPTLEGTSSTQHQRDFHSSSRRQGWHLIPAAAAFLKSSGALSLVQMVGRIALTLLPMAVLKRSLFRKLMKHLPLSEHPTLAQMHKHMQSSINFINVALWGLIIVPGTLFVATFLASLERTPVTGRWRLILLSPEEEKSVTDDLRGDGWRDAVANILTVGETEPLPKVIPLSDWRTQWVLQTWRHLESVVPLLQADDTEVKKIFEERAKTAAALRAQQGEEDAAPSFDAPFPPPSKWALMPRPRATTFLHAVAPCISEKMEAESIAALSGQEQMDGHPHHHPSGPYSTSQDPPAHALLGPPYSLLVVEKPQSANAFSYGFGPDGAGGVVVYSGFIDEILRKTEQIIPTADVSTDGSVASEQSGSGWNLLSLFTGSSSAPKSMATTAPTGTGQSYTTPTQHTPTPEQTTYLAILLAHELAHLVLSHHLETLSSNSILVPTVVGMFADLARTLAFPFTMIFGPFVNDALWEVSKFGTGEVVKSSEACRVKGLEIEADVVGARLLAYAGWDARTAIQFWEEREVSETCAEKPTKKVAEMATEQPADDKGGVLDGIKEYIPFRDWWNNRMGHQKAGTWFTRSSDDDEAHSESGGGRHAGGHPVSAERVRKLRKELERWEGEKQKYMKSLELQAQHSSTTAHA